MGKINNEPASRSLPPKKTKNTVKKTLILVFSSLLTFTRQGVKGLSFFKRFLCKMVTLQLSCITLDIVP